MEDEQAAAISRKSFGYFLEEYIIHFLIMPRKNNSRNDVPTIPVSHKTSSQSLCIKEKYILNSFLSDCINAFTVPCPAPKMAAACEG